MKLKSVITLALLCIAFISCEKDEYELIDVYTPEYMSFDEFRASSVEITTPVEIIESGKIYVYNNLILTNDIKKGIHVIDNSNPENPVKVAFIKITGNVDMEVKGNYLYADSYMDLLVFDLSNINNIQLVSRLKDVLPVGYDLNYDQNGIITGYTITQEWRKVEDMVYYTHTLLGGSDGANNAPESTGQGGSLARFKIVGNYLYAVDSNNINVFNITNLESPQELEEVNVGFGIETIFNRGNQLFLGSRNGMFIFDITSPETPEYISELLHVTTCDPVVVDDNYAYITLRAGNLCGTTQSVLQIVDITDIYNPELKEEYPMDNPYGLGIKDDLIFICDGTSGLKVYNKADIENLELLNTFENINTYDVIPMTNHLLMIGDNTLFQYTYSDNGLDLLSEFSLN